MSVGLLSDDVVADTDDVLKAIEMLPKDIKAQRDFRIQRALQLSFLRITLPQDQWTKKEDVRSDILIIGVSSIVCFYAMCATKSFANLMSVT